MTIGKPLLPPPADEASEATYERMTAELKARVAMMRKNCAGKIRSKRFPGQAKSLAPNLMLRRSPPGHGRQTPGRKRSRLRGEISRPIPR